MLWGFLWVSLFAICFVGGFVCFFVFIGSNTAHAASKMIVILRMSSFPFSMPVLQKVVSSRKAGRADFALDIVSSNEYGVVVLNFFFLCQDLSKNRPKDLELCDRVGKLV